MPKRITPEKMRSRRETARLEIYKEIHKFSAPGTNPEHEAVTKMRMEQNNFSNFAVL